MSGFHNGAMVASMQVAVHDAGRQPLKLRAKVASATAPDAFYALRLEGVIDEHNGLAQITDHLGPSDTLAIDLGGIKRLNSVGVRDWVNWLRALRVKYRAVIIFDPPPSVMNEVNFVKNFAEGAYITTFYAPLFCARCQKEESRLLETHRIKNGSGLSVPSFSCEQSDCENTLDDDPESYFSFIRTLPEGDVAKYERVTKAARTALAGALLLDAPKSLDAHDNPSAGRSQALGQLGMHGLRRPDPAPAYAPPAAQATQTTRGDWMFIAAMGAMLAVLGVLIYLIMTLE